MRISDWSSDVCSSDLFSDDWCRRHIGLRIAKSLGYANATGFNYHDADTNLLAAILTPYGKWRNPAPWDDYYDGPFSTDEMRELTRALLDHVHNVTGQDRKSVVSGKSVSGRVDLVGSRDIEKKRKHKKKHNSI